MPEFGYSDLLPLGDDDTPYRLLSTEGVRTRQAFGTTFTEVEPRALTLLTVSDHLKTGALDFLEKRKPASADEVIRSGVVRLKAPFRLVKKLQGKH